MTIFAQHGWGKSTMVHDGVTNRSVAGVIVSPRDETPMNLGKLLDEVAAIAHDAERFVDPQLYSSTIPNPHDIYLPHYPHYRKGLSSISFSPNELTNIVSDTFEWQSKLNVTAVVSPTVLVDVLGSQWAQVSMMFAQEAVNQHSGKKPLLISIAVDEDALRDSRALNSWLNDLTTLQADGFYIVVRRTMEGYQQHFEPSNLSGLLSICYSLAELNKYKVIVGYSDIVTLLLHAVGVTGTACGWHFNLKQFSRSRFRKSSGGQWRPPRYTSSELLSSVTFAEMGTLYNSNLSGSVLSGTQYDAAFSGGTAPTTQDWPIHDATLHHWDVLTNMVKNLANRPLIDRLDVVQRLIPLAGTRVARFEQQGILTTGAYSEHLHGWSESLKRFRAYYGI